MKKKLFILIVLLISISCITVKAEENKTLINIDYPSTNQEVTNSLRIQGWVMTNFANTNIEVYIDDTKVEDIERQARPDVIKAIDGYGDITTNPTPGFYKIHNIESLSYGNHTLKIKVLDAFGVIKEETRTFKKKIPETLINIDYPSINQEVTNSLRIQGWVMSTSSNANVEVYVDDTKIEDIERQARPDVIKAVEGYGDATTNPTPGFYKVHNIESLSYENHTLKVKVSDTFGVIKEETRTFKKKSPESLINIDYPSTNQVITNSLKIQGWIMSTVSNTNIEMYIDDTKIENIERQVRPDVIKAVQGYGDATTNPTPGFYKVHNIESLSYGSHTLKLKLLDSNNNVIKEETRVFKKKSPESLINIDYPSTNQEVTNSLRIQGWVMSTVSNANVEVYVDDIKVEDIERKARPDVIKAIDGYGDITTNPTPGIYKIHDIESLSYGNHTLKVKVSDSNNNVIKEETRTFKKKTPETLINIDYPSINQEVTNSLRIQGWVMSTASDTNVEVYVDDIKVEDIERKTRPDVIKAIDGYGDITTNPTPGIYKIHNIETLSYGNHTLKVSVLDKYKNEIQYSTVKFKKTKPKSIITIDNPTNIAYRNVLITGWYLAMENNTHAEVYFDDTKIESVIPIKRDDAINAYSEYKTYMENQKPGYTASYDATSLKDGNHKITIKVINDTNNDVISTSSKTFTLQKYKGKLTLDFPSVANINKDFSIVGWEMSELDNSYLKVYIDNRDISNTINRFERQDVINNIKDYGDASVNAMPGFTTNVAISSIGEGKHTIKIDLYTKLNEKIATVIKDIYIYTNIYNGIDISSYNNVYSWQSVKNSGIDYIIARAGVRGYGTAGNLLSDSTFSSHVNQATMYGIKAGAYIYSQAITEAEGVAEVNLMIQQVNSVGGKSKITLPLVIDTEFSSCEGRCGRADHLSREQRTRIVKTMAETIKANGYTPMIYASTSFLNNQLDMNQLREYSVWVAHY